ncbi:MAG TPA: hypothetical protein VHE55_07800 [Fimbriimonadaceae bacterium]|nr:hypothetical protein [Fimbriimonadaceae bacterium]
MKEEIVRLGFDADAIAKWARLAEPSPRYLSFEDVWRWPSWRGKATRRQAWYPRKIEPSLAMFRFACENARGLGVSMLLTLPLYDGDSPHGNKIPRSYIAVRKELDWSLPNLVAWNKSELRPPYPDYTLQERKEVILAVPDMAQRMIGVRELPAIYERYVGRGFRIEPRFIQIMDTALKPIE